MVVKATLNRLKIAEVPTTLSPDGRTRPPHLRSWRDGWRHLRFLLIYSPRWLFLYPGFFFIAIGLLIMAILIPSPKTIGGITFDIHTMLYASTGILLGIQAVCFSLFSKTYAINSKLMPEHVFLKSALRIITLARGLIMGVLTGARGLAGSIFAFLIWSNSDFGVLSPDKMMRIAIPSLTLLAAGIQIVFASFFLDVLRLKHK